MTVELDMAARRAALTLHALGTEDRAWVLAQLQPQQRARVEPLLGELRDLGIVVDRQALRGIHDDKAQPDTSSRRPARLERHGLQQLARVLEQEAPELTRALLAGGEVAWRGALLRALAPEFAQRVGRLPAASSVAPALHAALVAAVERRLAQTPANAKTSRRWWPAWSSPRSAA